MRQVTWKNEQEQTCVLTIQDDNDFIQEMLPSADPFTTAIQQSTELFTPIRTASGYVRVDADSVDDIADLVGMAPLQRAVELTVDGVVRWRGFLSCEAFSQAWDVMPSLELPVMSSLEALRGLAPSSDLADLGYISFAQFICNINEELGTPFETFYFPVISEPSTTLKYLFDMKNYATATDKNTKHEVADYYSILEDICKLFGWQCVEWEKSLVFMAADVKDLEVGGNNFRGYSATRMADIANGISDDPTDTPAFTPAIPVIYGAEHRMNYVAGRKSVEVIGQLNERDEAIWSMDVFQQCKFNGNNFHSEDFTLIHIRYTVKKMACITDGNIEVYNNVFSGGASHPDTEGNNIKFVDAFGGSHNVYGASITYEQFAEYGNTTPHREIIDGNLDFYQRLIIKPYSEVSVIVARMNTNFWYDKTQNQAYNAFRVTADVKYASEARKAFGSWTGQKYIEMSFCIVNGNTTYYYDKTNGWNTNGGMVSIYCSDGKIDEASYNSIPAPDGITGEVVLIIWASTDGIGTGYLALEGISISLYTKEGRVKGKASPRVELDELRESENTKKIEFSNGFTEAWNQECGLTLAREAVPDSFGVVLKGDKTLPADLYSGKYPEDAMADRAADYFARARLKINAIVFSQGQMLNPLIPYWFVDGGKQYICVEQQQNWKTNEVYAGFFEPSW